MRVLCFTMKLMDILKNLAAWILRLLFQLELSVWIVVATLVLLIGSAAPIKQTLGSTNFYDQVVDTVLKQSAQATGQGAIPLDNETVRGLIKDVFSSDQLRTYTENVVDGTYAWLEGKSEEPSFRIDLTAARTNIATGVANKAATRLATLPACTKVPTGQLDPFSIECLPPGINIEAEKQRIINEMLSHKDFLPETVITADKLPKGPDGKTFAESHQNVPEIFQLIKNLPMLLVASAALTAGLIIWLANEKRRGIRTVGRTMVAIGGFILGTTLLFGFALPSLSANMLPRIVGADSTPMLNETFASLLRVLNKSVLITSGGMTAVGGAILLAERFIKPKPTETTDVSKTPKPPKIEEPAKEEDKESTENETINK